MTRALAYAALARLDSEAAEATQVSLADESAIARTLVELSERYIRRANGERCPPPPVMPRVPSGPYRWRHP
jgi:hypothetical protein